MVECSKDEIQQIRLNAADEVKAFAQEYGLKYFLSGSTLLGAVRHRGFIPWNNSMSIMLPRPDYELLVRIFNEKAIERNSSLRLFTAEDDECYGFAYGKITDTDTVMVEDGGEGDGLGVGVKVFPIDGLGNDKVKAEKTVKKALYLHALLRMKTHKTLTEKFYSAGKIKRAVQRIRGKFTTRKAVIRKLDNLSKRHSYDSSELVGVMISNYGKRVIVPKNYFDQSVEVEFENRTYSVCKEYDLYLKSLFTDYMSLPPEQERKVREIRVYKKEKREDNV